MSEGPECQQKYAVPTKGQLTLSSPKPSHKIVFTNTDGHEVGTLDFSGHVLSFEGVADKSAIMFMHHVAKLLRERLQEEYDRGFKDGKSSQKNA